jgi:hypothetical protein
VAVLAALVVLSVFEMAGLTALVRRLNQFLALPWPRKLGLALIVAGACYLTWRGVQITWCRVGLMRRRR